jgi:hypothetical protein
VNESLRGKNPYVGPRAFERGDTLYGRDLELRRLLNLLVAERIVLLYSPSGAGKTSLIQAVLIPELEHEGFRVWPTLRVKRDLPPGEAAGASVNRYVLSSLLSLDEVLPRDAQTPIDELAGMALDDYLSQRTKDEGEAFDDVFVFDQFEEILTFDPTDRDVKLEFFEQLGEMLRNRRRWALFAMREEFIAGLDPYVRPIPSRFSATYRLELLSRDPAKQAMQRPASAAGVDFTDDAANKLVDDLRSVRVLQPDGTMGNRPGLYVEPVQLQVVCRHLWDRLPAGVTQIVETDLQAVGDVDRALADYYAAQVAVIAAKNDLPERTIREWIDRELITEQGIRGQVLQGHQQSRGLANPVIFRLVDVHLVRAEDRRGATWFELAHDRLIGPVRADNALWREAHLGLLQRQAALWEEQGRPSGLLLRDQALEKAESWAATHDEELAAIERDFLSACRDARAVAARDHRQSRRIRWLALGAVSLAIIAIVLAGFAGSRAASESRAKETAAAAERVANIVNTVAAVANQTAIAAYATSDAANETAVAAYGYSAAANSTVAAALHTAEADKALAISVLSTAEDGIGSALTVMAISQEQAGTIQELEATNQALAAELTPTPLPVSSTPSPTPTVPGGTSGPTPRPTPTATPSPTPTQTPDLGATASAATAQAATVQAAQEALAQVQRTAVTVAPTSTATPRIVVCANKAEGEFQAIWQKYKGRLLCPELPTPTKDGQFATQQYENGFMFWSQLPKNLILTLSESKLPVWTEHRSWSYDANGAWCASPPPEGLVQPIRGFGGVWCDNPEVRAALGWGVEGEWAIQGAVQEFAGGFILRTGDPTKVYVLFRDDQTYVVEAK